MFGDSGLSTVFMLDPLLDLAGERRSAGSASCDLLGAHEVRDPVARRATTTSTARVLRMPPGVAMYSKPRSLSKPGVRLRMTLPSLVESRMMSSSCSLRLPAATAMQVARRRRLDRERRCVNGVFSRFGREVAAVVGRPLLVAERLEAVLQVLLELLVELLRLELEGLLVGALAAADDALAQREEELPDAFLAPARFDELERARARGCRSGAGCRSRRSPRSSLIFGHDVGDGGVAHRHQVERIPDAASCSRPGPRPPTAAGCGGAATAG